MKSSVLLLLNLGSVSGVLGTMRRACEQRSVQCGVHASLLPHSQALTPDVTSTESRGAHASGSPLGLKHNTPALSSWGCSQPLEATIPSKLELALNTGRPQRSTKPRKPKKLSCSLARVTFLYQPSTYSENDMDGKTEEAGLTHRCGLFQQESSGTPACNSESRNFLPCSCALIFFPSSINTAAGCHLSRVQWLLSLWMSAQNCVILLDAGPSDFLSLAVT